MYRITNTVNDRSKTHLHRTATKFEFEPNLGGVRIRLGAFHDITDEHYARSKSLIDEWVSKGMVSVRQLGTNEVATSGGTSDGPTFEEWVQAGYSPDNYPPAGYPEIPSPGLTEFRMKQEQAVVTKAEQESAPQEPAPIVDPIPPPVEIPVPVVAQVDPDPTPPATVQAPVPTPNKNKKLR